MIRPRVHLGAEPIGEATKHYGRLVGTAEPAEQARQNRGAGRGQTYPLKHLVLSTSRSVGPLGRFTGPGRQSPAAGRVRPVETPAALALLVLRVGFGVGLAYHGYNKVFGGGGLAGTARWFSSIGMKWPAVQARLAAGTEIGAGLLFAAGLLTPFAAAGIIGVMTVAGWVAHRANGFLIIHEGWEYVAAIGLVAWAVAAIGPGRYSLDHALDIDITGWAGLLIALLLGVGGAIAQLVACYRPQAPAPAAPAGTP